MLQTAMKAVTEFSKMEKSLKNSLEDFDLKELNDANDKLLDLINSLICRQMVVQEVILERLDSNYYSNSIPSHN